MIKNLHENGMDINEIAGEMNISGNSVRKYLRNDPLKKMYRKRGTKIDQYRDGDRKLIEMYSLSSVRIMEEIRKLGCDGGYTLVKELCRELRKDRRIMAVYRYETEP